MKQIPSALAVNGWPFAARISAWAVVTGLAAAPVGFTAKESLYRELVQVAPNNYFYIGFLLLCLLWLYLRRADLFARMRSTSITVPYALGGLAAVLAGILLPGDLPRFAFLGLAAVLLGGFAVFFSRAVVFPLMAIAPLFVVVFLPAAISSFAAAQANSAVFYATTGLLNLVGILATAQDWVIRLTDVSGGPVGAGISIGCSGHTAIGFTAGLFLLMMYDAPLPAKRAVWMLALGLAGAWVQNLLRVLTLFVVGRFWGEAALWQVHAYSSYIFLPVWYALFAFIYLKVAPRRQPWLAASAAPIPKP